MPHREDCPCVNCNPTACKDCGMASPGGPHLNKEGVCKHRRACKGRQALNDGATHADAAAIAQGREVGGVAEDLRDEADAAAQGDRAAREQKVLETVREWLPELEPGQPGYVIQVRAADPDDPDRPDGALFSVTRTRVFACRR